MDNQMENYQLNLLALGFVIHQGDARVRRRWYKESGANFETIEDYLYDESGRLVKTIETDEWFQCVYAHDDRGRIIRTTHGPQSQDEPNPPTVYEYQYDEAGRVFLEFSYFEDYENPDTELTFQFDEQGRLTSMHKRYFNTSDRATSAFLLEYNETGQLKIIRETFSRGSSSTRSYHYDESNRLLLIFETNSYGENKATGYEYQIKTPQGENILNADFAISRKLVETLKVSQSEAHKPGKTTQTTQQTEPSEEKADWLNAFIERLKQGDVEFYTRNQEDTWGCRYQGNEQFLLWRSNYMAGVDESEIVDEQKAKMTFAIYSPETIWARLTQRKE